MDVVLVAPEIPQNTGSIGRLCVATGRFRAHMALALVNDGPVTLVLDTAGNA